MKSILSPSFHFTMLIFFIVLILVFGGIGIYSSYQIESCTNLCQEKSLYYGGSELDYCKCLTSNGEVRIFDKNDR